MGKFSRGKVLAKAIGEENFDKSTGSLSFIPLYLYIMARKIWQIIYHSPNLPKFSPSKIFPCMVYHYALVHVCLCLAATFVVRVLAC